MLVNELKAYRKYVNEILVKGFIKNNFVFWAVPILFVLKANSGLRFYIDYYKFNAIIRKD